MKAQFYFSFLLMVSSIPGYWFICSKSVNDLDQCAYDTMFIGNKEAIIPTNDAEMDQHCSQIKSGIKCLYDYSASCLTGVPQQASLMVFKNMDNHMNDRCNKPDDRQDFLNNVKCFNPREKMNQLNVCNDKNIVMMEKIKGIGRDDRMAASCCSFHLFHNCIVSKAKEVCGDGASQYWDDMIREVAEESVSFACGDFDSIGKCSSKLKPDIWSQLKAISDSNDPNDYKHNYRTLIPLVLEMIQDYKI